MKFFKQTKETKRRISFFMALAMMVSLLPVSPTAKANETKTGTPKTCNVYVVNECTNHIEVSKVSTGEAVKAGTTTSAAIELSAKNAAHTLEVKPEATDIPISGAVTIGSITVKNTDGEAVTSVAIKAEKVTDTVLGSTTSCAISSSPINGTDVANVSVSKVSDKVKITIDGANANIKITLSYSTPKDEDLSKETKHTVTFSSTLKNAKYTVNCNNDQLSDNENPTSVSVTSGSSITINITPTSGYKFESKPVVTVTDTTKATKSNPEVSPETDGSYTATVKIEKPVTITISGTATIISDAVQKFNVKFTKDLTNATATANLNEETTEFTGGKLETTDKVKIAVKPANGYVFNENNLPLIEAAGAVTSGSLDETGVFNATVTKFTKDITIKVSAKPAKSQFSTSNGNKEENIGKAEVDISSTVLENNKDKIVNSFKEEDKKKVKDAIASGGSIVVDIKVELKTLNDADNTALGSAKPDALGGTSVSDIKSKGKVLDITLEAICKDENDHEVARTTVSAIDGKITIKMSVKDLFTKVTNGYTRTYFIIKIHEGKVSRITCNEVKGETDLISFETNSFSTYILMYEDKKDNGGNGNGNGGSSGGIGSYVPSGSTPTPAPSATPSPSPSTTPAPSDAPGVTTSPAPSGEPSSAPSESSKPSSTPDGDKNNDKDNNTGGNGVKVNVGKKVTVNSSKYKVTSVSGTRAVQFTSGKKNAKTVVVPATVKISGKNYKVTSIANNAFKNNKKLKKVTIGTNVNKIGKAAFKGCKNLKSVIIKTKKLTAKKVGANAFKGINKKAVFKVPKKKVKAYKKIVKAKGAAKTVKVKK